VHLEEASRFTVSCCCAFWEVPLGEGVGPASFAAQAAEFVVFPRERKLG